jgi:hypothetical protein
MVLIGMVSFSWLPAAQTSTTVVDFVYWLMEPERQVLVDEMILKTESLGLVVNAIEVFTLDEWLVYAHGTHDYDLLYGPFMTLPKEMNIVDIAFICYILTIAVLHEDKKIFTKTDILVDGWFESMWNPDLLNDEEFVAEMTDAFNVIEKRLWIKQYFSTFVQFETETSDEWGVPSMRTDTLNYNCLKGRVFFDTDLRVQLNSIIDRNIFYDYYEQYTDYDYSPAFHLFQFSPYHDAKLTNDYNF